jgi:hypothetical protein
MSNLKTNEMKKFTKGNIHYLLGFSDNAERPEGIFVQFNTEGYYEGKHTVDIKIETSVGIVDIKFSQDDYWGYVNSFGVCKLNGNQIQTSDLIGEHHYTREESNLLQIVNKLYNL